MKVFIQNRRVVFMIVVQSEATAYGKVLCVCLYIAKVWAEVIFVWNMQNVKFTILIWLHNLIWFWDQTQSLIVLVCFNEILLY